MVEVLSLVYGLQVINSHRLLNKFAESARVNPRSHVSVVFLLVLQVAFHVALHIGFTCFGLVSAFAPNTSNSIDSDTSKQFWRITRTLVQKFPF